MLCIDTLKDMLYTDEFINEIINQSGKFTKLFHEYGVENIFGYGAWKWVFETNITNMVMVIGESNILRQEVKFLTKMKNMFIRVPVIYGIFLDIDLLNIKFVGRFGKEYERKGMFGAILMEKLQPIPKEVLLDSDIRLNVLFVLEYLKEKQTVIEDLQFMVDNNMNPVFIDPKNIMPAYEDMIQYFKAEYKHGIEEIQREDRIVRLETWQ